MAQVISDLCKVRDILVSDNDKKIAISHIKYLQLADKIRSIVNKKTVDKDYEMDITAQDLRELSSDIKTVLNRWETFMNGKNQTTWVIDKAVDGKINVKSYTDTITPYLRARFNLVALDSLCIYTSTMLYLIEIADGDEFAIKNTERVKMNRQIVDNIDSIFNLA